MVPHLKKEDTACTKSPNQISSTWLHLVEGVQAPRVSHHSDTALIADTTLIAEAPHPAGRVTEIPPRTLPGRDQWSKTARPTEATPTQSPAQKTPKLKSLVQRVPTTKNYHDPPYNCLDKDPKEFIRYLMGNLDQKAYDTEIRCLATFYSQATSLSPPHDHLHHYQPGGSQPRRPLLGAVHP